MWQKVCCIVGGKKHLVSKGYICTKLSRSKVWTDFWLTVLPCSFNYWRNKLSVSVSQLRVYTKHQPQDKAWQREGEVG